MKPISCIWLLPLSVAGDWVEDGFPAGAWKTVSCWIKLLDLIAPISSTLILWSLLATAPAGASVELVSSLLTNQPRVSQVLPTSTPPSHWHHLIKTGDNFMNIQQELAVGRQLNMRTRIKKPQEGKASALFKRQWGVKIKLHMFINSTSALESASSCAANRF